MRAMLGSGALVWLLFLVPCRAATVFVSQSGGSVSCGADGTQGTTALASATWTAGNTYKLCGTLTSAVAPSASGSSGNVITIFFESGSKISMTVLPSTGGINLSGKSFITVDGGVPCGPTVAEASCQGIIEATANGTLLTNQVTGTVGINVAGASNITIQNLLIRNVYVHVTGSGSSGTGWEIASSTAQAVLTSTGQTNFLMQDSKIHDANWALQLVGTTGNYSNLEFARVDEYNVDHCLAIGVGGTNTADTVLYHDSHCHDTSNWDDTTQVGLSTNNHHDGIHLFTTSGSSTITNVFSWNNKYDGDWGQYTTAEIFEECVGTGHVDHTFYNSFFTSNNASFALTNGTLNDGNIACSGTSHTDIYNNTFLCTAANNTYCNQLTVTEDYRNNVEVNLNSGFGILTSTTGGTSGTFNFNIYGSSTASPFYVSAVQKTYSQWKAAFSADANSPAGNVYASLAAIGINSSGVPQTGFVGAGAGVNLCNGILTCTGHLAALANDANGVARPPTSAWDIGAYQFSPVAPAPTSALFAEAR